VQIAIPEQGEEHFSSSKNRFLVAGVKRNFSRSCEFKNLFLNSANIGEDRKSSKKTDKNRIAVPEITKKSSPF